MSLEGCGCGEWFAVLFDARRHRRGIGSERWAASSVFDVEMSRMGVCLVLCSEKTWLRVRRML